MSTDTDDGKIPFPAAPGSPLNDLIAEGGLKGFTFIWGDYGVGKSTMCMTAALSVLYGSEKKVIYINSNPRFNIERMRILAEGFMKKGFGTAPDPYRLIVFSPQDFYTQTELIMELEYFILNELANLNMTKIGLIILDTASVLKILSPDYGDEEYLLEIPFNTSIATLDYISDTYGIPIIVTNNPREWYPEHTEEPRPHNYKILSLYADRIINITRKSEPSERSISIYNRTRDSLKTFGCKITAYGFDIL